MQHFKDRHDLTQTIYIRFLYQEKIFLLLFYFIKITLLRILDLIKREIDFRLNIYIKLIFLIILQN